MEKPKFIPVCEPTLIGNELKYVIDCVKTNWISSGGKYINEFEKKFAGYCNRKYGVTSCNGSAALHMALEAIGLGPGDEVIVPDFTMFASVSSIMFTGAKPVFVDVEKETWCMNPNLIEEKITNKTKAIMAVHIYGHPVDMDKVNGIAKKYNLLVIEDAAEAHGAMYKGKKCGSMSNVACFSFYGNKILTTGEGGMIVTDDEKIVKKARQVKDYGFGKTRFISDFVGYNFRMTNMQAAIGLAQLERVDKLVNARIKNAHSYNKILSKIEGIITPPCAEWAKNVYWMYGIMIMDEFGMTKEELTKKLREKGIDTRAFFIPMHKQPAFKNKDPKFPNRPDTDGNYPVADELGKRGFYLPSSGSLTEDEIRYVVDTIKLIKENG